MRNLITAMALLATGVPSHADSEIPFPQLNTEVYCSELVSKMLNKDEKKVEFDKCMVQENDLRTALQPYWPLVRPKIRQHIMKYFTEPQFETYFTVYGFDPKLSTELWSAASSTER